MPERPIKYKKVSEIEGSMKRERERERALERDREGAISYDGVREREKGRESQ